MLGGGYFAVFGSGSLDWPTALLTLLGLCLRALMVAGVVRFEFPARVIAALAIGYIGFFPLAYLYVSRTFLTATVHMVVFLAVLQLLTAKTARDYAYLEVIAGLEPIAATLLSAVFPSLASTRMFV